MNLPVRVDDPSLIQHEPLRSFIPSYKDHMRTIGHSVGTKRHRHLLLLPTFVRQMQQNRQAAAAALRWACLVFQSDLPVGASLDVTDEGGELYMVFFDYQYQLHQGLQYRNTIKPRQIEDEIRKRGFRAYKLKVIAQHATEAVGGQDVQHIPRAAGQKTACRKMNTGIRHPAAPSPDLTPTRNLPTTECTGSGVTQQGPPLLPGNAKPRGRSTSKERKVNSQCIAPSVASKNDKESFVVTATNYLSRPSKRFASLSFRRPYGSLGVKNKLDNTSSAHKPDHREDTGVSQHQSPLTGSQSNNPVAHPNVKGRRDAGSSFAGRKHDGGRFSSTSIRQNRASSDVRGVQAMRPARDFRHRANKRTRRASTSASDGESGEAHQPMRDFGGKVLQEPATRESFITGLPPNLERIHAAQETRLKQDGLEFETASVAPDENAPVDPRESLGPDNRFLRPLPHKVCDARSVQVACGVPHGIPTLEDADQLLRDAASNAQAVMQVEVQPDVLDWTQDNEHDADCDNLGEDNQDKASDVNVTTTTPGPPKPPVPALPHIWAQSRQEVCESFEYFRCYHSGVYSKDDIVQGYLLGAYAASRDIFHHDGKLIISHGGGKSEAILDVRNGTRRYQTDQDQNASDRSVRALLKTCKDRRPIVLLADDRYALFPYDLTSANCAYVVLGLYWISHAWAECQSTRDESGRIVRWKFAFQWCEGQADPWWIPQQDTMDITSSPRESITKPISTSTKSSLHPANTVVDSSIQCGNCQERSPSVYSQSWMCLNPRCDVFWTIGGEEPKQLEYREEFLNLLPQNFKRLPDITPTKVTEAPGGVTTTHAFSKGWHCTKCGRLSCRYKWEYWECSNCKLRHAVNGRIRSPKEFWHQRPSKGFLHSQIGKGSGILACRLEPINLGGHKGFTNRLTFILPDDSGKIHLVLGTPLSNGDADDIFQLYQQQASTGELKLRRYPLRNHRARGLLLTNYFSQNSGEPYQYVGGSGQTVPFCEAPDCVRKALALIKEKSILALGTDVPFNEVLSAAYMERQKMAFHSDSEKGLGPIVASLSLGSAALMHFRRHADSENPKVKNPYALSLVLRHGDVLIMDGDGVQKYYEHTVVPMNFRIAATARCIGST